MMKEKYETLPLTTLKELAKARGLKGISTMKKAQVIELMLQEDEKEQESGLSIQVFLEDLAEGMKSTPLMLGVWPCLS